MKATALTISVLAGLTATAAAQEIELCDWQARVNAIPEPWEDYTRTYANGKVRLALLDALEPAAGPVHILVLSPPYDELGARQCRTIGMHPRIGFGDADFSSLEADYDASVGLIFTIDVKVFDGLEFQSSQLRFTVNQSTGAIGARLR